MSITRTFTRTSDGARLARIDTNSPMTIAEAEAHAEAEYGFPVTVTEAELDAGELVTARGESAAGATPRAQPPTQLETRLAAVAADRASGLAKVRAVIPGMTDDEAREVYS